MLRKHIRPQRLSALIDNELSSDDREAIYQHLEICRKCREKLQYWQRLDPYLLQGEDEIIIPPFLNQKVLAQVQRETATADLRPCDLKSCDLKSWLQLFDPKFYFTTAALIMLGIILGTIMGTKLTNLRERESRDSIDILAILSSEDSYSSSIAETAFEFINGSESYGSES